LDIIGVEKGEIQWGAFEKDSIWCMDSVFVSTSGQWHADFGQMESHGAISLDDEALDGDTLDESPGTRKTCFYGGLPFQ